MYRVAFYASLLGWIYGATGLANSGADPWWIALFSGVMGYLSSLLYLRGYESAKLSAGQGQMLFEGAKGILLVYFALLTIVVQNIPVSLRGILIAAGFYFLAYWLAGLNGDRRG